MSRDKVIIAIGVILLAGVGVFFVAGMRTSIGLPTANPQTIATSSISQVTYDANGKIDTSGWKEYRSEYGGFSVRAPKDMSMIGCSRQHNICNIISREEDFNYILTNADILLAGFMIEIMVKSSDSTLDTWLNDYIVSGRDKLLNVQKTVVDGYPALQFDRQEEVPDKEVVEIRFATYPTNDIYKRSISSFAGTSYRFLVIDLGNRYVFVSYTLSIEKHIISKVYADPAYSFFQEQLSAIPSDKTLSDIYAAILNSFQAFTPTKP
jgi:hypothetical protein